MTLRARSPELSHAALTANGAGNACDEEPISHSGAVQPHGLLLGVDPATAQIAIVSDNIASFTGAATQAVLGSPLSTVIGPQAAGRVLTRAEREPFDDINPLPVVLPERGDRPWPPQFEMVAHWSSGLIILELTAVWDSAEDMATVQRSMRRTIGQPLDADDVTELCTAAVHELRELTGYDRVMAYRFAPDAHGEVIAEACRPDQDPLLGLHYPAGDIPRQARLLYFRNRLRMIADVDYQAVGLSCRPGAPDAEEVDLSQSRLRSVSPVHLEYLRTMGVAATMTISVVIDDHLWGMLACHHDSARHLSYHVCLASETLGARLALQIRDRETRQERERSDELRRLSVQVVTAMAAGETLSRGAEGVTSALVDMVGADGAVLEINGERIVAGRVPPAPVIARLLGSLERRAEYGPVVTDALPAMLRQDALADDATATAAVTASESDPGVDAAGAMYIALDHGRSGCVLWLRGDQARTVRWAGAPTDADAAGGNGHLSPRASFAEWRETVRGRSRPWRGAELTVAAEFAEAMPELLLRRAQNRLVRLALHDALTGLANRVQLLDRLNAIAVEAADREAVTAVLFIDLDEFKSVNDTLGHSAGDALLVRAAGKLRACVRPDDTVARMGGDEFVVILDGLPAPDGRPSSPSGSSLASGRPRPRKTGRGSR